ncbi:Y-family DNA polymerase [Marinobacterium aestuariivivens]|uniref:Y-family DNA polymerase n=1 Tax=Marinobacterium aestuariivivens TaxID=1698799 RepID=A0ABW2A0L2_9GAMM
MNGLWLYLHFPLLPLEMLCGGDRPVPAALLDDRGARVRLCNAPAREQGVRHGMAVATALSLVPELQLVTPCPVQEPLQLEGLALWSGRFSARVSLQPPAGLLLEIASMLHYFKGLEALWQELQAQLGQLQLSALSATGHTPLAARLLALDGGFCAADAAAHLGRLEQLPTARLELETKQLERLQGLGLQRLGQLLALPGQELAHRLGPELTAYLDRLTGRRPDPPRYFEPPEHFRSELPLPFEVEQTQALLFPLRRLLAQLEGFLRARHWRALRLRLELLQAGRQQALWVGHAAGEQCAEAWLELCRLRLERLQLEQPVTGLRLAATEFRDLERGREDLFSEAPPQDSPAQLLSRLQMRLGDRALCRLEPCADYRPERSWRPAPLQGLWRRCRHRPASARAGCWRRLSHCPRGGWGRPSCCCRGPSASSAAGGISTRYAATTIPVAGPMAGWAGSIASRAVAGICTAGSGRRHGRGCFPGCAGLCRAALPEQLQFSSRCLPSRGAGAAGGGAGLPGPGPDR